MLLPSISRGHRLQMLLPSDDSGSSSSSSNFISVWFTLWTSSSFAIHESLLSLESVLMTFVVLVVVEEMLNVEKVVLVTRMVGRGVLGCTMACGVCSLTEGVVASYSTFWKFHAFI